jgi:AcrR family transcriptional regulator
MATKRSASRSKLSPTKQPRQERSRATVEALLEAAADILIRHGYAKLTTNRIAERAGVNIASLYQYFPGKEAIVAELRRRHGEEQRAAVRRTLRKRQGADLRSSIRALVSMGVAAHTANPELQRVFSGELPDVRYADVAAADPAVFADFRQFLQRTAVGVPDLALAQWMVSTVAYAVIHRAIIERAEDLSNGRISDELTTLLVRYLKRTPEPVRDSIPKSRRASATSTRRP